MSNQVELILSYQKVDEELFKEEREFSKNADNVAYVKAVKKIQGMQETLEGYEKTAQALLERFNSFVSQQKILQEEKVQLEESVKEATEVATVDYLRGEISKLASGMDELKVALEELEKEINRINSEYLAYAKEIKEAKEFGRGYKETFDKLNKDLKQKREETNTKLKELESGINAEFLAKYKARRADKKVVFPLVRGCNGTHCSLCGVELSISAKNKISTDDVIECENCHKFVYKE